jgi:hypothetical protein
MSGTAQKVKFFVSRIGSAKVECVLEKAERKMPIAVWVKLDSNIKYVLLARQPLPGPAAP